MSHDPNPADSPLALRLFSPETAPEDGPATVPPEDSPEQTLSEFFARVYLVLVCQPRKNTPATIGLLQDSLHYWQRLTGDPSLSGIDDFTCSRFVQGLLIQPGRKGETLSLLTVSRHCKHVQRILDFAGPRTRDKFGRRNRQILEDPPILDYPKPNQDPPHGDFSLEEIRLLLAASKEAVCPLLAGVTPAAWWQAFLIVGAHTGLRVGSLMQLRYSDLQHDANGPYLLVASANAKGRKGKRQPLTAEALAAIESIRTRRNLIFEFPNWRPDNTRWLLEQLYRLQKIAGVQRRYGRAFHGLRKFYATQIASSAGGLEAAAAALGHSSSAITKAHYVSGAIQDRNAAKAQENLPSLQPRKKSADQQKTLFDL